MGGTPVSFDFSKAQPLPANPAPTSPAPGVTFDFGSAQAVKPPAPTTQPPAGPVSTSVDESDENALSGLEIAGATPNNVGAGVGAVKSFLQPAVTIAKLLRKGGEAIHPGLGNAVIPEEGLHRFEHMTETRGPNEVQGEIVENIAEFMLGDEAIKSLSLPQKLSKIAPFLKSVEKFPKVAELLGNAIRQGGVSGAQGLAHGEDPGTAGEQAVTTGALSGLFEGVSNGAKSFINRNRATLEKVGGVDTVVPASVRNAAATEQQQAGKQAITKSAQDALSQRLAEVNQSRAVPETGQKMLPARTGPFTFELKGLQPTETSTGSATVPAAEMPRNRITGLPEDAPKGSNTATTRSELGTTTETVPPRLVRDQPYMTSAADGAEGKSATIEGGGTLRTQDPNVIKDHVKAINEIVQHPDFEGLPDAQKNAILQSREEAQQQLSAYHQHMELSDPRYGKPNFPQIDIPSAVKTIGSYSDAANYLQRVASDGYNNISDSLQLNNISGGKFATIRNANRAAWDAYKGASSIEAMTNAEHAIDLTNKQMADLLKNDIGGSVTPKELQGFNDAYGQAQKLKYVAHAVDSSFSGNASASARSWEYRGFDGNKLMANLGRLEQKFGRTSLERVVGRENLNTLYQVAELNRTQAARSRFGVALHPVAEWLANNAGSGFRHLAPAALGGVAGEMAGIPHGWLLGATTAEGVALATRKVFNAVLSNPKIAQNLIFAIESGARPQYYGPLIGTMVQQMEKSRDDMVDSAATDIRDKASQKKIEGDK